MTVGGLGKKCFESLNKQNMFLESYNQFFNKNVTKYKFVERFRRGGISYVQYKGKHDRKISVIDLVSQYPAAFMKMKIPIGHSKFISQHNMVNITQFNNQYTHYHGFYIIKNLKFVEDGLFVPISMSVDGKSLNWKVNWSDYPEYELAIDSEMLKWLIKNDGLYQFDIVEGLVSKNN